MPLRKFGAVFRSRSTIGVFGGLSAQTRTRSTDLFRLTYSRPAKAFVQDIVAYDNTDWALPNQIEPRMCHAIANCKTGNCLLIGGRASPDRPLSDCWHLEEGWRRVEDLPYPLYRHCASWIKFTLGTSTQSGVLVYGGKTNSNKISGEWLLWRKSAGWCNVKTTGDITKPRFGAAMASTAINSGIMTGGMTEDGLSSPKIWQWTVTHDERCRLLLEIKEHEFFSPTAVHGLARMGAQLVWFDLGLILVGGMGNGPIKKGLEILKIHLPTSHEDRWKILPVRPCGQRSQRLLIGHSVLAFGNSLLITGGGAVCFSFGSFWDSAPIILEFGSDEDAPMLDALPLDPVDKMKGTTSTLEPHPNAPELGLIPKSFSACSHGGTFSEPIRDMQMKSKLSLNAPMSLDTSSGSTIIPRQTIIAASQFTEILKDGKPVILSDMSLGTCVEQWTLVGLKQRIGAETKVTVHESNHKQMDFLQKNFVYKRKIFGTFIDEISRGARQYLRSLSEDEPSGKPARIDSDFPELTSDFALPIEFEYAIQNLHSSVLRISGPVDMWLHYDVRLPLATLTELTVLGDGKCAMSDHW